VKWLLDTNVVSESVRPNPSRRVLAWIAAHPGDQFAISILTIAELHTGVAALNNVARQRSFELWMSTYVLPNFRDRTLPVTLDVLVDWLNLSRILNAKGGRRPPVDLLIAATARVHDLTIVTRNVRDFVNTGVVVYDPWSGDTHVMDAP
jgi:toxin FitB